MPKSEIQPFDHPAAWQVADFPNKDAIAVDLEPRHIEALLATLADDQRRDHEKEPATPARYPLTAIADDVADWARLVERGRGLLLLRGFPVDSVGRSDLRRIYLALGCHFGRPVSQSAMGDLVGDVVDVGGKDRRERAYRNSRELNLHTDRCDHIGMLCIRPAARGGLSGYASALAIHNRMLAERPELLTLLYRGYFHHRFGEQPPGEPPITSDRIPIFSVTDGVPSVIYIRGYIDLAVEEGHVTLTDDEREALDLMDRIANRPDIRLNFGMAPGEICFVNNCLLLHTRTAFEDADDPALKRHFLRLWLRQENCPMAPGVVLHKGSAGILKQAGKGTYYAPPTGAGTNMR